MKIQKAKLEVARMEKEKGSCEGWVCFGKAASLIMREGKKSLQVNNSHAIDFSSSSAPHQSCCKINHSAGNLK